MSVIFLYLSVFIPAVPMYQWFEALCLVKPSLQVYGSFLLIVNFAK